MIGKMISHYQILEKLGEGGMGVVYKARDTKLDRTVALKFLPLHLKKKETDLARFIQEAKAAAALNHPNVCTIHEIDETGENPFIVMEYVEGKTLRKSIHDILPKVLNLREVGDYAIQIAEALKAAHKKGIVHRDVKSENIMVTESGKVKVMDFGLAKLRGSVKLTKSSGTVGTIAYMSPEHLEGKEVDGRTDIFSFGVVLYEMLTGQLPFKGDYDSAMMYAIVNEDPEPVQKYRSDLSSELLHVLNRALEKDPDERYQTVDDMFIDLRRLKRETDWVSRKSMKETAVAGPSDKSRTADKSGKNRLWIGIGSAAVLLILILAVFGEKIFPGKMDQGAVKENSIAVLYFENHSGEEDLEKILTEMLTSNLSRCPEIDVMSSQRLFDILKNMGKQDSEIIDRNTATEVATKAHVQNMLVGSIHRIGSQFNINAQLCDVKTGKIIGPSQAQGSRVEDIYQMVDRLTGDVIRLLGISLPEDRQPLKINDVTTNSFTAYKHYRKGIDGISRFDFADAIKEFQQAVEIDSTFAMAFLYLAWTEGAFKLMSPLSDLSNERKLISLAQEYSDNVTIKEHNQIGVIQAIINRDFPLVQTLTAQSLENYPDEKSLWLYNGIANSLMGDMVRSIHAYEKVLEIDPAYANAYMCIAYDYSTMNEHEKAIFTAKKYLALQPDVWNTYDTAWDIYMDAGMYDAAYSMCEEALKVNKDWWHNFEVSKSLTDLIRGDGNKARDMIHRIKDRDPSRLNLFEHLGCFYMYEGRFKEAADAFSQYVKAALEVKSQRWEMKSRLSLGRFLTIEGRYQEAQAEFIKVKELSKKVYADSYNTDWIIADFYAGKSAVLEDDLNKAEAFSEDIRGFIEENNYDPVLMDYHFMLRAEIDIAKKKTADALKMLDHVSVLTRPDSPNCRILYARIDIQKEDLDKAIEEYQGLYDDITTMFSTEGGSLFTYLLERSRVYSHNAWLYEQKGDSNNAILSYQRALDHWANADADLPELVDARARLAKLKGEE